MAHTSGYAAPDQHTWPPQPGSGPEHRPPEPPAPPSTIRQAVAVMWIGAALSVLGGVLGFFLQDEIREAVDRQIERQGTNASGLDPDTFVAIGLVAGVIGALVGATLWIVHAVATGRGRQWARITGTVLFAISVLFFLIGLVQPAPALSRVAGLLQQLVGLAAVVLIWMRPSTEFVEAAERARRGY
jgi:hypothetical protein